MNGRTPLSRVVLLLVVYATASSSSSSSIFGSPYLLKSCSLEAPSIPMMFLLPLRTTTRLGFDGSVMKKHWSTWLLSSIAELPDLLDPSVVSFFDFIGVGFHRYPGVL